MRCRAEGTDCEEGKADRRTGQVSPVPILGAGRQEERLVEERLENYPKH